MVLFIKMGHHMTEEEREDLEITLRRSYRNHIKPAILKICFFSRDVCILIVCGIGYLLYLLLIYLFNILYEIAKYLNMM